MSEEHVEYSVELGDKVLPGSNVVMCKLATGLTLHFNRGVVAKNAKPEDKKAAGARKRIKIGGVKMTEIVARGLAIDGYTLSPNPLVSKPDKVVASATYNLLGSKPEEATTSTENKEG